VAQRYWLTNTNSICDAITAQQTSRRLYELLSITVSFSKHSKHCLAVFPQSLQSCTPLSSVSYPVAGTSATSLYWRPESSKLERKPDNSANFNTFGSFNSLFFPLNVPFHALHNTHCAPSTYNANRLATGRNSSERLVFGRKRRHIIW
jgi:hypothetical protein